MKKAVFIFLVLPAVVSAQPAAAATSSAVPVYAALGIAVLALLAGIYVYTLIRGLKEEVSRLARQVQDEAAAAQKRDAAIKAALPRQKLKEEDPKAMIERMFNKFNDRLIALEDPEKAIELLGEDSMPPVYKKNVKPVPVSPEPPAVRNVYAKLPDLGNGFSEQVLLDVQNGEQIYELCLKDGQGTYVITSAAEAQRYALSDYTYYLQGACEFANQPVKNSSIRTRKPGVLAQSGTTWVIVQKADIEFG